MHPNGGSDTTWKLLKHYKLSKVAQNCLPETWDFKDNSNVICKILTFEGMATSEDPGWTASLRAARMTTVAWWEMILFLDLKHCIEQEHQN